MRRRWVMIEGELVEVTQDYVAPARSGGTSGDAALWNDRIYQDGGDPRFSSREQHRDYMRQHGLTTADDFTGEWKKAEQRRVDFRETGRDSSRRSDMIASLQRLLWKR